MNRFFTPIKKYSYILIGLTFLIATFFLPNPANAQSDFSKSQRVTVIDSMEVPANLSRMQVEDDLLKQARKRAVEQVTGVRVNVANVSIATESGNDVFESYQELVRNSVSGRIIQESEPKFSWGSSQVLYIHYSATVAKETESRDQYFDVEMEINKPVFTVGGEMQLTVELSKDAYITIFSITEGGKVSVLFPNAYMTENFVDGSTQRIIPNDKEKDKLSFTLQSQSDNPKSKYAELLLCIATKEKVSYDKLQTDMKYNSNWLELNRWLMKIPRDHWAQSYVSYQVFPK